MERAVEFHRPRKLPAAKQPPNNSGTSLGLQANSSFNANANVNNNNVPNTGTNTRARNGNGNNMQATTQGSSQCIVREQDQYMPIANVIRIMRRILPPHAKISDDAKETIQECVSEYISFITGEANERCQREQRKTITAEDVLWAMSKLGFDDYVEPLTLFINRYRENESARTSLGEPILKRGAAADNYGTFPMPPFTPSFSMADPHAMFDAAMLGGYYRDASSGSGGGGSTSSQNPLATYDPFAQFK